MNTIPYPTRSGRRSPRSPARPQLELLESRTLLSVTWPGLLHPITTPPAETEDAAPSLAANLNDNGPAEVVGSLGTGPAGAADVNWYSFTLIRPAHVTLDTLDQQGGSSLVSVLSVYAADPNDPNLSFTMGGYNLAAQADGATTGGDAHVAMDLTAGTYYVAVSGSGNRYFHPFVPGSGLPGSTGAYGLRLASTDLTTDPGPVTTWFTAAVPSTGEHDTAATAIDLGDVSDGHVVQAPGILGDDSGDPTNPDPNEVDLYHFHVNGGTNFALAAEVFAGRIGSAFDPGLSLFKVDANGQLVFVDANDNSQNGTQATNATAPPMYNDPILFDGLATGDYYLAVSSSGNVPDASEQAFVGQNGVFDPNVPSSGTNGWSTGSYVLNFSVQAASQPPMVLGTTPGYGVGLAAPPTTIQVQFNVPVNLQQLVNQSIGTTMPGTTPAVTIQQGTLTYYPRLVSYDPTTNLATFVMYDALPNGPYQLHVSGPAGLTDLAGDQLAGNNGWDYVTVFAVEAPDKPLLTVAQEPNDSVAQAQVLGPLFWNDLLTNNLAVQRNANAAAGDTADYYQFNALYNSEYTFRLSAPDCGPAPAGLNLTVCNLDGTPMVTLPIPGQGGVFLGLNPGTYLVRVDGWTADQAPTVAYRLTFGINTTQGENATPLTLGASPAVRLQLVSNQTPSLPTPSDSSSSGPSGGIVQGATGGGTASGGTSGGIVPVSNTTSTATVGSRTSSVVLTAFVNSITQTTSAPSLVAVVPPEVLQALAAGPVGGVGGGERGTTVAASEKLTLSTPQLAALDAVVQSTVLTQSGTTETSNTASADTVRQSVTMGTQSLQRLLDRLFSLGDWSFVPTMPTDPPTTEKVPSEPGEPEEEEQLTPASATPKQASMWGGALVVLGLAGGTRWEKRKTTTRRKTRSTEH